MAQATAPNGGGDGHYYRQDGVRITHDPYAPGVAEKYGLQGATDADGFDPYADTVGPGIYGGEVERDPASGAVVIGTQYQSHNPRPGPVYKGTGYSIVSRAIHAGPAALTALLADYPQLAAEISTGGATPLHMCGMSQSGQRCTQILIDAGADIEALDTYGMTPLQRMASNNLAAGAAALLAAGARPDAGRRPSAVQLASEAGAEAVLALFQRPSSF